MSGKGSAPRPKSVDDETFSANWERAFGKRERGAAEHIDQPPATPTEANNEAA